jgi:hypothetical protein
LSFDGRADRPTHARTAAVRTIITDMSAQCDPARLPHTLRREAAVFAEMCACAEHQDA